MTEPRPEIARMTSRTSGYYGLRRWLLIRGASDRVWRWYWRLQPIRCVLGWHDWYDVCAGEAVQCRCGAFQSYHHHLVMEYRWRPWLKSWAARVEEAEYCARFWQEEFFREREPAHD